MFKNIYQNLLTELNDGNVLALLTFMNPTNGNEGGLDRKEIVLKSALEKDTSMDPDLKDHIVQAFAIGTPLMYKDRNKPVLIEPFFPKPRLIILGGGHIAKPLSEFGAKVGFSVLVADDRPSFANSDRFPEADEIICESFEKVFESLKIKESDFVVIVTRGHRHDGICLRNTFNYNPAYMGMISSKRRLQGMMKQLVEEGYPQEKLDKINSPIGLSIGAVTPEEIAISIIAEVISYRRALGIKLSNSEKFSWPEFDMEVMDEIHKQSEIPNALVTITQSRGSVPRKAGAKMIVWMDGRTLGSIGGGCSEANIASLARDVILNKGYSMEHVDMTGLVAEDEGMVCGGTIDVLIEAF